MGQGTEIPDYEKEKPRPGYVGMGFIPNPRQ